MTEAEFSKKLKDIEDRFRNEVVDLMEQARTENADGMMGDAPVDWAVAYAYHEWEGAADAIALLAAWIYDRLKGRHYDDPKGVRKKIRKALGYAYP